MSNAWLDSSDLAPFPVTRPRINSGLIGQTHFNGLEAWSTLNFSPFQRTLAISPQLIAGRVLRLVQDLRYTQQA